MTAEEIRKKNKGGDDKQKEIPDFTAAWKKLYFDSEESLARAIDNYVSGQSFTDFLEQMGRQYLSCYKATSQNMDRFLANNPIPSKKDIARVAELVVAIEEKVDNLESDLSENLVAMAASVIKLVDYQAVLKDEILNLQKEVRALQTQINSLSPKMEAPAEPAENEEKPDPPPRQRGRNKKTNDQV